MKIKNLLSFALLLEDEFSGRTIADQGCGFVVNGKRAVPMLKPDGFYVFTGVDAEEYDVTVSCAGYQPRRVRIQSAELKASDWYIAVRLFRRPGKYYPDSDWLAGSGHAPGSYLYLPAPETLSFSVRSVETEEGGATKIGLLGYSVRNLAGLRFCVGSGKTLETFVIRKKIAEGLYQIDRGFLFPHREGEPVARVFTAESGEDGTFSMPVEAGFVCKDPAKILEGKELK
ncbi:MAG: carboxypeptidase regulatory-like domain-containing protein [Oscillospiraceae bacterium]|nr:carboxypeptidase regulatory-like domain-containing protein [Oscillospiraceae bacterium]